MSAPRVEGSFSRSVQTLALLGLAAVAAGVAACGSSGGGSLSVTSIQILQAQADVSGCSSPTSVQLTLSVHVSDGSVVDYSGGIWPWDGTFAWSSDDPSVASVVDGNVAGVSPGRTTIRATVGALQASVPATVSCQPGPTASPVIASDVGTSNSIIAADGSHAARNIAIDDLGRIHVSYFDPATGLRYARSIDGGVSFQPSVLLVGLLAAPAPHPIIACGVDAQDNVYVVYQDSASAVRCLRSSDGGTTWTTPGVVTGLPSGGERSASVRGATVMIFTTVSSTMARSTDSGQTFGPVVPSLLSSSAYNDVLMDPRNATGVIAISDDPSQHMKVSADDGATFGAQTNSAVTLLFFSDYAIDQLGNVFGVSNGAAWIRASVDVPAFTTVASSLTGFGNPGRSVAVDSVNVVHVVREGAGSILLQTSADQGATITPEATLDTGSVTPECAGSFFFPGVGVIYVKAGVVMYVHD